MSRELNSDNVNEVVVYDNDIILVVFRGQQTQETIKSIEDQVLPIADRIRLNGKKIYILADALDLKPSDTTTSARQQARVTLTNIPFDKLAICSKGPMLTLATYIVRLSGRSRHVQFFRSRRTAQSWLVRTETRHTRQSSLSLASGVIITTIGLLTLLGWQLNNSYLLSWIPDLRPMNPISALALVLLGIGFMTYSVKKLQQLRWSGVIGILLGTAALLPLHIDTLLYGNRVSAFGVHGEIANSAAICFIAIGIVALVANRPNRRWRRPLEATMVTIVGALGLVNVFGQLYAREWIYSVDPHFVMAFNLAIAFVITAITLMVMLVYSKVGVNKLARISRISFLVIIVLLLTQIVTYAAWSQATTTNRTQAQTAFETNAHDIENALQSRFTTYTNLLYGFQGLFLASKEVSQGEFEAYYKSTNVAKNYPGLQTLSFISKVNDQQLPVFIQAIRNDKSLHPNGNPTFTITGRSPSDKHYILSYIADSTAIGGTDFGSNASRLLAFQQAEAKNQPIASGTIKFAATATAPIQNGFFITVPIAYENDHNKIIGFVNAVFNYRTFFANTFDTSQLGINVSIIDINDGRAVFNTDNTSGDKTIFSEGKSIEVADRTWIATISGTNKFIPTHSNIPTAALVGGQVFSLLLIIIFWMQARGRKEALELVDDVTKDLQEERNLAVASDQKSRAILSSIGDGVFVVDVKGRISVFNAMAASISGYTATEALGKPYGDILRFESEETGKVTDQFIRRALGGHLASMANHSVIVRKDGQFIPVADSAAPIRDVSGNVIGAIIVFRDVTKEYQLEKAKAEFVSLTSHQLRTPLSAINWYAEMLMKGDAGKLTETQSAYIKEIFNGSNRMGILVNALLDVSRLQIDKLTTQPEPTNISAIITGISKELKVVINNRKQVLHSHLTAIPLIEADPRQLHMIVQNLMSNAVKYTPEKGAIDVTLRLATDKDMARAGFKQHNAPYWFFSVQDTGYGIPKGDQPKIFGKLFRADNARALNVEGTGLGLFIVKQVVEKMGGHVWFESIESVGTTFYVVTPIETKQSKQ